MEFTRMVRNRALDEEVSMGAAAISARAAVDPAVAVGPTGRMSPWLPSAGHMDVVPAKASLRPRTRCRER
jgi:hypothetical protein